jgi:hypothetical protein
MLATKEHKKSQRGALGFGIAGLNSRGKPRAARQSRGMDPSLLEREGLVIKKANA